MLKLKDARSNEPTFIIYGEAANILAQNLADSVTHVPPSKPPACWRVDGYT